MELHYLINDSMKDLANRFFIPSLPPSFSIVAHESKTWTSGEFGEDNYGQLMIERTSLIVDSIKKNLDNSIMVWMDIDILIFKDFTQDILRLAENFDLLFQREHNLENSSCCFGVQVIRRNLETLIFYSRILLLQKASDDQHDQKWGNEILSMDDAPRWMTLPTTYSSVSNGGMRADSFLFHANSTITNSVARKVDLLANALVKSKGISNEIRP